MIVCINNHIYATCLQSLAHISHLKMHQWMCRDFFQSLIICTGISENLLFSAHTVQYRTTTTLKLLFKWITLNGPMWDLLHWTWVLLDKPSASNTHVALPAGQCIGPWIKRSSTLDQIYLLKSTLYAWPLGVTENPHQHQNLRFILGSHDLCHLRNFTSCLILSGMLSR